MSHSISYFFLILILTFSFLSIGTEHFSMDEICNNAIDDDNDGLIDINDPDCICKTVDLESLFPNPSFEEFTCCPETFSQFSCLEGWDQASGGTTDFLNTCDYLAEGKELLPFPDGQGAVLFLAGRLDIGDGPSTYNEYAGACLNKPMKKDSAYRIKFHIGFLDEERSPEFKVSFFGSPSCMNIPFSENTDCPSNYPDWYFLKSEIVKGNSDSPVWIEVSTRIQTTMDINAIVIGAECGGVIGDKLNMYFLDNLRLNNEESFDFERVDDGNPCSSDFTFAVKDSSIFAYQWYKEGIALPGENQSELSQMYGEGVYQLRIINANTLECRIADQFEFSIPFVENDVFATICRGEEFLYQGDLIDEEGIYEYSFKGAGGCDSIVNLHLEVENDDVDTIYARVLSGATYKYGDYQFTEEGNYEINLPSNQGCDRTVLIYLENIDIYVPNAFSPNEDGINDYFEVFTSGDEVLQKQITIFDRWGSKLFEGERWNGRSKMKDITPGVYTYVIQISDAEGRDLILTNAVTLLR